MPGSCDCLVVEVPPHPRIFVAGEQDAIVDLRGLDAAEIDPVFGIALDLGDRARPQIETVHLDQVEVSLVGLDVGIGVGGIEPSHAALLEHRTAVDRREARRIDAQDFGVAVRRGALGQPQFAGVVEIPGGDLVVIAPQQRARAGGQP